MALPLLTAARVLGLTRSALDNARSAGDLLTQAVTDRRALAPSEDEPGPGGTARLDEAQCLRLLATRTVGRLAYVARAGTPDITPVNYALHGRDVLVRSGPGPKLQAAERREVVALEVDDLDEDAHTGWSVVVVGQAQRLEPHELHDVVLPQPWSAGPRRHVLCVRPQRITGRRLG